MTRSPDSPALLSLWLLLGVLLGSEPSLRPAALAGLAPLLVGVCRAAPWRPVCGTLALGMLLGAVGERRARPPPTLALPGIYEVCGRVSRPSLPANGKQRFVLTEAWVGEGTRARPLPDVEVTLAAPRRGPMPAALLHTGQDIRAWIRLDEGPTRLARAQRSLRGWIHDPRALQEVAPRRHATPSLGPLRLGASRALATRLPRDDAALARALLLGDRQRLSAADRARFRNTGQVHLLAVSGLHVGLVLAGFLFLLRHVGAARPVLLLAGMGAALLFVLFAGAPPSALRAGIGSTIWMGAALLDRRPPPLALLSLVACAVLYIDAGSIDQPAFQMSFAAVLGILLLTEPLRALLVRPRPVLAGVLPPLRAPLRSLLAVGCAAWLGTAPFVAHHIGQLCPLGPLIALPALPLTAVLIGSGALCLLAGPAAWIVEGAAFIFCASADLLRRWLDGAVLLGVTALPAGRPPLPWWPAYGLALWLVTRPQRRTRIAALGGVALLLAVLMLPLPLRVEARAESVPQGTHSEYDAPPLNPVLLASLPVPAASPGLLSPAPLSAGALVGVCIGLALFALVSTRPLRWLRPGGALGAWVLGSAAAWAFGVVGLVALFAPFLVATLLGKLPGAARSGARNLRQVASNGLPALAGCILALLGHPESGLAAFLGGLSCLGADTCATEVGVRYGGAPFRLAGRGPLVSGESGGVTWAGLAASLGGALLAPLAACAVLGMGAGAIAQLLPIATAGVAGGLIDSVLGGTLQFRGIDPETGAATEARWIQGRRSEHLQGLRLLDNDGVNLLSGILAALIAMGLVGTLA